MLGMTPQLNVADTDNSQVNPNYKGGSSGGGQRGNFMTIATGQGKASASFNDMPSWVLWVGAAVAGLAVLWLIFKKKGRS